MTLPIRRIEVIRTHNGTVDRIPTKKNADANGEYYEIVENNIVLHINKFCTFAMTYQNELQETKQKAVEEILATLPENATEEQKAEAEKAIEAIKQAETPAAVNEAKEQSKKEIEEKDKKTISMQPCTHHVNAVCFLYDAVIDIPVLNAIFNMLHRIIHAVKTVF